MVFYEPKAIILGLPPICVRKQIWTPCALDPALVWIPILMAAVPFGAERIMEPIRSRVGVGSHPIGLGSLPVRCRTGGGSSSGPNEPQPPLPLAWVRSPFATECVMVCIRSRMGFSALRPLVSALPVCCRSGIRPLWCERWIRSQLASKWLQASGNKMVDLYSAIVVGLRGVCFGKSQGV